MLRYPSPLLQATFVRRYQRFFADFELPDGSIVTAHCANPGSMKTCLLPGARCWLSVNDNPKRKLRYTWQVLEDDGELVFVNPAAANDVVVAAIREGVVSEFCDYSLVQREVKVSNHTRIDLVLRGPAPPCYVEIKNATLKISADVAAFPDSVTARGTRHLEELVRLRAQGERAVLFFCVSRSRATSVQPADDIDPTYGKALRVAVAAGVEVLAYGCDVTLEGVRLARRVTFRLPRAFSTAEG